MTTDRRAGPRQGPYVAGGKQPRSRNDNGSWRKKRSDTGKKHYTTKGASSYKKRSK